MADLIRDSRYKTAEIPCRLLAGQGTRRIAEDLAVPMYAVYNQRVRLLKEGVNLHDGRGHVGGGNNFDAVAVEVRERGAMIERWSTVNTRRIANQTITARSNSRRPQCANRSGQTAETLTEPKVNDRANP